MFLFDEAIRSSISQFEYTYNPQLVSFLPDLYHDASDVGDLECCGVLKYMTTLVPSFASP